MHHLIRNVCAHVGGVLVAAPDALQSADNLKAVAIEEDEGTDSWTSGEEMARQFIAQHYYVAFLRFIEVVEPAPLQEREKTDAVILRLGSGDLTAGIGELADGVDVVGGEDGSDGADMRDSPRTSR